MSPVRDPRHLAPAWASAVPPVVADYPHNIDKEVMVKGI